MAPHQWRMYRQMFKARLVEDATRALWLDGLVAGEMHLGLGEEGIVAGVIDCLREEDAVALDHRGSAAMVMLGVDIELLFREFLGQEGGLCAGRGGHMHLFSSQHQAASSGIVGASGPTAAGFALAAQMLRPKSLAVAFFGEGAMNQGMLMESLNLAVVWKLPVLFVCKDNDWSITTRSSTMTGGDLLERAKAFGLSGEKVDGWKAEEVRSSAIHSISRIRKGSGPGFLLARCAHFEGHFLGDPLLRVGRNPIDEAKDLAPPLMRSVLETGGGSPWSKAAGLTNLSVTIGRSVLDDRTRKKDPLVLSRSHLESDNAPRLESLESEVQAQVDGAVERALAS